MILIKNILTIILLIGAASIMMIGSIGIIRLPGFFSRLHAAGKCDTLGVILFISGMMIYTGWNLISLKLLFIFILAAMTNPVGSHALVRAAFDSGLKPWLGKKEEGKA